MSQAEKKTEQKDLKKAKKPELTNILSDLNKDTSKVTKANVGPTGININSSPSWLHFDINSKTNNPYLYTTNNFDNKYGINGVTLTPGYISNLGSIDSSNFIRLGSDNELLPNSVTGHVEAWKSPYMLGINSYSSKEQIELENEITKKRQELEKIRDDLLNLRAEKGATIYQKKQIELKEKELKKTEEAFSMENTRKHIFERISPEGQKKLTDGDGLFELFSDSRLCHAVVISIDIRKSTDLMLQAREPKLFAEFITGLSKKLATVVTSNYGVFDKFTGDGVLAFFPTFYSGHDAIYYALKAAQECHEVFAEHYNNSRNCFNIFVKGKYGLGIGIDYGPVTLFDDGSGLTIVGVPVVYACRLGCTKVTLLNQPARELAEKCFLDTIRFEEIEVVKHEEPNKIVGYTAHMEKHFLRKIDKPNWDELIKEFRDLSRK